MKAFFLSGHRVKRGLKYLLIEPNYSKLPFHPNLLNSVLPNSLLFGLGVTFQRVLRRCL